MKRTTIGHSIAAERHARPLTGEERKMLDHLAGMREDEIDTTDPDAPVLPPEKRANAVVGKFYRPIKKAVNLRIDADVLNWFKSQGAGYQTRINQILRQHMYNSLPAAHPSPMRRQPPHTKR